MNYSECFAYFDKGCDRPFQMFVFMGSGKLNPYSGLPLRDNRKIKTNNIDAFCQFHDALVANGQRKLYV